MSKIFIVNTIILILGNILICTIGRFFTRDMDLGDLTLMIFSLDLIIAQLAVNLIIGFVCLVLKNNYAKYYFLSMIVVVLVGVPLCFGGAYLTSLTR